jgi:hypothetical protein
MHIMVGANDSNILSDLRVVTDHNLAESLNVTPGLIPRTDIYAHLNVSPLVYFAGEMDGPVYLPIEPKDLLKEPVTESNARLVITGIANEVETRQRQRQAFQQTGGQPEPAAKYVSGHEAAKIHGSARR